MESGKDDPLVQQPFKERGKESRESTGEQDSGKKTIHKHQPTCLPMNPYGAYFLPNMVREAHAGDMR